MIIAPYYNATTGDLEVYVTSDLWSPANGSATFQWYQWNGSPLTNVSTPTSLKFTVGALNATRVLATNTNDLTLNYQNAILHMTITAQGQLPNTAQTTTFTHANFFHALPLSQANLVDPGIKLSHSDTKKTFTVEATTGIAAWTWLDYPAGAVLNFDTNAFFLLPGQPKEIAYTVKSDTSGGKWTRGVTVESLWNNTLPY